MYRTRKPIPSTPSRKEPVADARWMLPRSTLSPGSLAQVFVTAATTGGARCIVPGGGLGAPTYERLLLTVTAAQELVHPHLDVSIRPGAQGEAIVAEVDIPGANLQRNVPYLLSEGQVKGQRERGKDGPRAVPRGVAEERLRHAGLADDELADAEGIELAHLDPAALTHAARRHGDRMEAPTLQPRLLELHVLVERRRTFRVTLAGALALGRATADYPGLPRISLRTYELGIESARSRNEPPAPATSRLASLATMVQLAGLLATISPRVVPARALLLEALVNAVVHRSYAPSDLHLPIAVERYADAIVVRSPGGPLSRVGMVGSEGPATAFSRNPRLLNLATALGLARSVGAGTRLLRRRARPAGFLPASFAVQDGSFVVVLQVDPEVYVDRVAGDRGAVAQRQGKQGHPRPAARAGRRVSPAVRDAMVHTAVAEHGSPVSAAQVAAAIGVSVQTVRTSLRRLLDARLVRAVGGTKKSPRRKYIVWRGS